MINFLLLCGCGGMADAADSKSAAHKACGFKSRHPHYKKSLKTNLHSFQGFSITYNILIVTKKMSANKFLN